jgi:hypothetical protein
MDTRLDNELFTSTLYTLEKKKATTVTEISQSEEVIQEDQQVPSSAGKLLAKFFSGY